MNYVLNFLKELLPCPTQVEWGAITSVVGTCVSYLFGWDGLTGALLTLMVIDYISGVLAAYINPNLALNSQKGFRGICKKVMILLIVAVAHVIDNAIGQAMSQAIVVWFFIGNEGLSIVENAAKSGVPVPQKLCDTLEQLKKEKIKAKVGA